MKSNSIIFSVTLTLFIFVISGCKPGAEPTATAAMLQKIMAKTWVIKTETVDGTDETSLFSGMTLNFTATSYTTTNGGVMWPSNGTWQFTDETATAIKRNDGLMISIDEATETSLSLSFTWATTTFGQGGRVESVAGKHVFTFQ